MGGGLGLNEDDKKRKGRKWTAEAETIRLGGGRLRVFGPKIAPHWKQGHQFIADLS